MPAARKAIDKLIDILCAGSPPEAVGLCLKTLISQVSPDTGCEPWETFYIRAMEQAVGDHRERLLHYASVDGEISLDRGRAYAALKAGFDPEALTEPRFWSDATWNGAEQPVVGVSWYEAVAFCHCLLLNQRPDTHPLAVRFTL
jgi:hypothetical protein